MRAPAAVRGWNRGQKQRQLAERRRYWKRTVCRDGCVMCNAMKRDPLLIMEIPLIVRQTQAIELRTIEGHHILTQQALKRRHLEEHLWDERNGVGLCVYHHARHTHYVERMPRELVPEPVYEFAEQLGIAYMIDHEYPV